MNTPTVNVGGQLGCIFEGEMPDTYCFVPRTCLTGQGENIEIAELDYAKEGWDVRNVRMNDAAYGEHLFPNPHRLVSDLGTKPVRIFLDRVKNVHSS